VALDRVTPVIILCDIALFAYRWYVYTFLCTERYTSYSVALPLLITVRRCACLRDRVSVTLFAPFPALPILYSLLIMLGVQGLDLVTLITLLGTEREF
jgi:hypothetical protein